MTVKQAKEKLNQLPENAQLVITDTDLGIAYVIDDFQTSDSGEYALAVFDDENGLDLDEVMCEEDEEEDE